MAVRADRERPTVVGRSHGDPSGTGKARFVRLAQMYFSTRKFANRNGTHVFLRDGHAELTRSHASAYFGRYAGLKGE